MPEIWVPIVAIIVPIIGGAVIIFLVLYYNHRKRQVQSKEILAAIEKGIEVPFPPPVKRDYLRLGIIWTFIGIAFTLAMWFSTYQMEATAWGFLPLAMGLAFLLIGYVERKKGGEEEES
ncbi:MAG: hypothetical protein JSU61_10705 [Fidelibacterota bacterium]|nr:MAG: hypothetical protein JSU61_10705 [Candidatus Neomarinimicrobiota bacterium]